MVSEMSSVVQNILHNTLGDGARSAKFNVMFSFTNPKANPDSGALLAHGKTSSFPGKANTTIDFKYKGRTIPIKGQVKYTQSWECTFYLSEDHTLKHELENWIESLDQRHNYLNPSETKSVRETQLRHNVHGYTQNAYIYQRDFEDTRDTAKYTLFNVFPTEISPVQVNYESRGELLEFTCTFSYSHYSMETIQGTQGNFIDQAVGKAFDTANGIVDGNIAKIQNVVGVASDLFGTASKLGDLSSGILSEGSNTGAVSSLNKQAQVMGANIPPSTTTSIDSKIKSGHLYG